MTQPINTFQDILDALEREPDLTKQLRRHILTQDLLNLPAAVGLLEPDEPPMIEQVRNLNGRLDTMDGRLENLAEVVGQPEPDDPPLTQQTKTMASRLGNVAGGQYEDRIAHRAVARVAAMGVERARIVLAPRESRPEFHDAIGEALTNGLISQEEQSDLLNADVILQGANRRHAVIEASLGPDLDDLQRAARRAAILARATGEETIAVAVAPHFADSLSALAIGLQVELVQILARSPDRDE